MKIHQIINRNRRDFTAIYVCENCNFKKKGEGYDDEYFHDTVIPEMKCSNCGKTAPLSYKPIATKYNDGETI